MLEVSQIQVLLAVAQSETLSLAAESLNITQSAVSQALKSIEAKVGFPIVARQGKHLVLTSEAHKLAHLGKTYIKKFDSLVEEIHESTNQIKGTLAMGTMSGLGKSWVASKMIDFSVKHPDLSVKIALDFPEKLLARFETRNLDCLILPESLAPAHAEQLPLHKEYAILVLPKDNHFGIGPYSTLKDIAALPLIFFEEHDPLFYHWCREKFGSLPRNIKPKIVVNAFGQILQAVHQGLGVAVVPTHVLARSYFREKVATLGDEFTIKSVTFNFVYHPEDKNSLKIKSLYDDLLQEVKALNLN